MTSSTEPETAREYLARCKAEHDNYILLEQQISDGDDSPETLKSAFMHRSERQRCAAMALLKDCTADDARQVCGWQLSRVNEYSWDLRD